MFICIEETFFYKFKHSPRTFLLLLGFSLSCCLENIVEGSVDCNHRGVLTCCRFATTLGWAREALPKDPGETGDEDKDVARSAGLTGKEEAVWESTASAATTAKKADRMLVGKEEVEIETRERERTAEETRERDE